MKENAFAYSVFKSEKVVLFVTQFFAVNASQNGGRIEWEHLVSVALESG